MPCRHTGHQMRPLKIHHILFATCTTCLLITPCAHAEKDHRPRIGLVLGGGGARGIAHVGILQWLEAQNIPVDCIAGTSMGAIVGGAYAAGMKPHDMAHTLQQINWPAIFTDGPTRADLPPRAKQKQRALLTQNGVGMKNGAIQLPKGLINGQNLLLFLEELALPAATIHDFDQLKIPYRAIATDLATGTPVVLGSGRLSKAMRASMSIPSALTPVAWNGQLLVDGGVSNNVPIDVARHLCRPDILIVVDVGAPLEPVDQLTSILSITNQLTSILTVRNAQQQIKTLTAKDILITPDLQEITSVDFEHATQVIAMGYRAAEQHREQLAPLSLSPEAYQRYTQAQPSPVHVRQKTIDFIHLKNHTQLDDQVILSQLQVAPGDPFDPESLSRQINTLYGMGGFEQITYTLVEEGSKTGLLIEAEEQEIGMNTVNLGAVFGANMKGNSFFNLSAAYTQSHVNALGAEWRTFAEMGSTIRLATDFYQPFTADQRIFSEIKLGHQQYDLFLQNDDNVRGTGFRIRQNHIGMETGYSFGNGSQATLGIHYNTGSSHVRLGIPTIDDTSFNDSGYSLRWTTDTLDNLYFPSSGTSQSFQYYQTLPWLGADQRLQTLSISAFSPYTWGASTITPRIKLGGVLSGEPGPQNVFLLGGLFNLSGYQINQLAGKYMALAEVIYMYRLDNASAAFTLPVYVGLSLEAGGVWNRVEDINGGSMIYAGSLSIGANTPLGPFYLGAGLSEHSQTFYLALGKLLQ